jgi:hypothetical protein
MEGPWVAERARVNVDSVPQPHWIFSLHKLTEGHWVSVARGPPTDVIGTALPPHHVETTHSTSFGHFCESTCGL